MKRLLGMFFIVLAAGLLSSGAAAQDKKSKIDLEAVFKKLDTNSDGKLSKDEFVRMADRFTNKEKAREKLGMVFDKIDPDNKGLSRIQFRQYLDGLSAKKKDVPK